MDFVIMAQDDHTLFAFYWDGVAMDYYKVLTYMKAETYEDNPS